MKRIVLLYPKAIGDFMFVLPALHTLRRAWPEAHITLVVKQKQAPLAVPQAGGLVDTVQVLGRDNSWRNIRRLIKDTAPDCIADLAGNDQTGLLLTSQPGQRRRPHRRDCKGWAALYTPWATPFDRLPRGLHRVTELLTWVQQLGGGEPVYSFKLVLPDEARAAGEEMVARYDLRSGPVIALNIGASRNTKRWPATFFRELARQLVAHGCRVVFMGARTFAADQHYDRRCMEQWVAEGLIDGQHFINLVTDHTCAPALQLQRDAWFLRYSGIPQVTVGNDTGPLHMAGSVGEDARNKTVSLFGPTNWRRYAPYDPTRTSPDQPHGQWNRVLLFNPDCGPAPTQEACTCYRRGDKHKTCAVTLDPDTVCQQVLASSRA